MDEESWARRCRALLEHEWQEMARTGQEQAVVVVSHWEEEVSVGDSTVCFVRRFSRADGCFAGPMGGRTGSGFTITRWQGRTGIIESMLGIVICNVTTALCGGLLQAGMVYS